MNMGVGAKSNKPYTFLPFNLPFTEIETVLQDFVRLDENAVFTGVSGKTRNAIFPNLSSVNNSNPLISERRTLDLNVEGKKVQ